MKLLVAKLMAHLPPTGWAWLPVGVFAFNDQGRVWRDFVDDDPKKDPGQWKYRVRTALEVGELAPSELVTTWADLCNDRTWSMEVEQVEVTDEKQASDYVHDKAMEALAENVTMLAELESYDADLVREAEGLPPPRSAEAPAPLQE
jgi:hypothetical protein